MLVQWLLKTQKAMDNIPTRDQVDAAYLNPGIFVDSDHADVKAFAAQHTHAGMDDREKAVALYYAVRDGFRYDPYNLDMTPQGLKASDLTQRDYGYCIEKANLLAAAGRAVGIPSRLGFANVRNHIGVDKFMQALQTDVLVFHGYTELWVGDLWVKATPAFNKELCAKFNVAPLEWDGTEDSMFQEFNDSGEQYMEYLHWYGTFADVPRELLLKELAHHYPHLFEAITKGTATFLNFKA